MQRIFLDDWTLAPDSGELSRDGKTVRLQEQPLQVLLALLEKPGQIVTREELIARLWPKVVVDYDTSLKSIVRKLRLALGDTVEQPRYIETLPRKGYRFVGPVRITDQTAAGTPTPRSPPNRVFLLAGVLAAIAVAVIAFFWAAPTEVRLGILPFRNLSPDSTDAFFAEGLYDEVLTAIASGTTEIEVVSRTTMLAYGATQRTAADMSRELGVTHLLEGSVRRDGADVRLSLQLVDTRRDEHLWARNFDRTLGDAMTLQVEVADAVAAQLGTRLSNRRPTAATDNPEAFLLYVEALTAMKAIDRRTPLDDIENAIGLTTRAIALDDSYAAAYALRAQLRLLKYVNNHDLSDANREAARTDIEIARDLAGDAVATLQARSRYSALFEAGPEHAIEFLDVPAVAESSEADLLLWRAFFLCRAGRFEEGLSAYAHAAELDPENPALIGAWVRELWSLRRPVAAREIVRAFDARAANPIGYGDIEFAFTGSTERLRADIDTPSSALAADNRLLARFDLLRFEGRLLELAELVEPLERNTIRLGGFREYGLPGTGTKPVEELRGWVRLLNGEAAAAAADGRSILAFVATHTATQHNAWHRQILAATGALFVGDKPRAVAATLEAIEATPPQFDFVRLYSMQLAARIFAWAGAEDRAMDLLETLSSDFPALGPAEIVRDPLFSRPLAVNPRYLVLREKLESEMRRNRALWEEQRY